MYLKIFVAAITLKPYQGLKLFLWELKPQTYFSRNHTKTLLGIETSVDVLDKQFLECRNHTKTLLGIETWDANKVEVVSQSRNHTKTLLGIETKFDINYRCIGQDGRNHTKTLLGIETSAKLTLWNGQNGRNHTKTLLGIETPLSGCGSSRIFAAITLKPYQGLKRAHPFVPNRIMIQAAIKLKSYQGLKHPNYKIMGSKID